MSAEINEAPPKPLSLSHCHSFIKYLCEKKNNNFILVTFTSKFNFSGSIAPWGVKRLSLTAG